MNPERPEPRRNRIATETSASDGWVARFSRRLPESAEGPEVTEIKPEAPERRVAVAGRESR